MQVEDIDLDYVISIIPSFLVYEFRCMNLRTLGDVLNIDLEAFSRLKNIDAKAVQALIMLQRDIIYNSSKYISANTKVSGFVEEYSLEEGVDNHISRTHTKKKIIPAQIGSDCNLIESFRKFDIEYYDQIKKDVNKRVRDYDMLRKEFGVGGEQCNQVVTGALYGISRERVRQIRRQELSALKKMFKGEPFKYSPIRCSDDFLSRIESFRKQIGDLDIVSQAHAYKLAVGDSSKGMEKDDQPYLDFLMRIIGYEKTTYSSNKLYFNSKTYTQKSLKMYLHEAYLAVRDSYRPLEATTIADTIKKRTGKPSPRDAEIAFMLSEMNGFEQIVVKGKTCYQSRFDRLSNTGIMAARVLFEAGHPLHFTEIARIINDNLVKYGSRKVSTDRLRASMSISKQVASLGKRGKWSLAEWGFRSLTVRAQMEQALRAAGFPMTTEQLLEAISSEHYPVRKRTMSSFVKQYKNVFARLDTGEIVLREWGIEKEELKKYSPGYDSALLMRKIVEIFQENNQQVIRRTVLRELLAKKGYLVSRSTFYGRILRFPVFFISPHIRSGVALKEDFEHIIESVQLKPRKSKRDTVYESIIHILQKKGNKMAQSKLIAAVEKELQCTYITVYRVIQDKALFIKEKIGKTVYVSALAPAANDPDQ